MAHGLELRVYDDLAAYKADVDPFLLEREAENGLFHGLLTSMQARADASRLFLGRVVRNGKTDSLGFHTGHALIATRADLDALDTMIAGLARLFPTLPGIVAHGETSDAFAERWIRQQSCRVRGVVRQRIYVLERLIPPRHTSGASRWAEQKDVPLVVGWVTAFHVEALPHEPYSTDTAIATTRRMIDERRLVLWTVSQRVVSMAALSRPTPNGIWVNAVYTPPEERRRGYASAVVADVTQRGLDMGKRFTALYTDLDNPTSNSIYIKMGYEPICDSRNYWFDYS
ncbi:MAG: GNAT family N-acetyltransferase [Fimbriimonas sp.]|nr:GNAT family N-acetyltransferase [Fimbriimonas sp.]